MTNRPTAQDYIDALEQQRNSALNEVANLRAEVTALRREVAEQEAARKCSESAADA